MAAIAILVDIEYGHIFPTFRLAKKLMMRGHSVYYLGLADTELLIRREGMQFRPLMKDLIPEGFFEQLRAQGIETGKKVRTLVEKSYFAPLLQGKMLDTLMQEIKPSAVLMTCHQYFEALAVRYKYNVPVILLNTQVKDETREQESQIVLERLIEVPGAAELVGILMAAGIKIKRMADIAALILQMPELTLFPKAFELEDSVPDKLAFYGGHEVDLERAEQPLNWDSLKPDGKVIYCSLGSQLDLDRETSRRFIQAMIDAVIPRPDWQLVVSLGSRLDVKEFGPVPLHVWLSPWVPQLRMLTIASVMVTHAGIGTVKECILNRVPMMAVPLMRDQFRCADRIVHHGLGVKADIKHIESQELAIMLEQLIADDSCRQRVTAMREEFERAEALNLGVRLIEGVIAGCSPDELPLFV